MPNEQVYSCTFKSTKEVVGIYDMSTVPETNDSVVIAGFTYLVMSRIWDVTEPTSVIVLVDLVLPPGEYYT